MDRVREECLDEALRGFKSYEKKRCGYVVAEDFLRLVQSKGMDKILGSGVDGKAMLADADPQSTGRVWLADYIMLVSRKLLSDADEELQAAFATFTTKAVKEPHAVDSATLIHVVTATGSQLDRVTAQQAAAICECPVDAPAAVRYKHILDTEAGRRDTRPLKEQVFANAFAEEEAAH
eukprot:TRINITY_DN3218_c0_g1_i2.p1 TRINITY_DN3218_c0_g1~~TRINITY_DN3218_c0_g1_i2.p1  ORF type:complete len:178 (+),score=60.34 TRINITY_DN3218_c0_g1_i2:467-1000(+)